MRLISLLAVVALAYATSRIPDRRWLEQLTRSDFQVIDTEFRHEREYKFIYNGQLAIGIPGSSSQHSATRIQALVSLIFKTKTEVYLQMLDVRMGKLNDQMPNPREILPFDTFEHIPMEEQIKRKLMAPIKFHYKYGMISEVVFDRIEQPWSANIKRGILNMLQVNLNKQRRTDMSDDALISRTVSEIQQQQNETPGIDFYAVMENTIEGECETFYTVTSQPSRHPRVPRPVLNITKSINFEKCTRRPDVKYNFRFQDWCPTCEARYSNEERMLRSSTILKYNMTVSENKEDFLLESVIVESQYAYVPFNEQDNLIYTYVNQTLVLIKTSHIESPMPQLHDPIPSDSHMIFTPDWDIAKERFFMEGESDSFHNQHSYPDLGNKVEFVKKILQTLAHHMNEKVEEEAPRQFTRLVKLMRLLKPEELERVHQLFFKQQPESFTPEEHKRIKGLLPDAVGRCGTKVCLDHLVEKIKERDVRGLKAVLAINQLNDIRVVSEPMIEKLWSLAQHEVCQHNPILRQSVYLTIGTLINALCAENEDKLAVEFKWKSDKLCPRTLKEKLTQRLFNEFRSSRHVYEKILLLKTIGNAGIDISIFELEKIIKNVDKIYSRIERIEAILALRQLKDQMPRKVQKILMPIYLNRQELPTVRMVALSYLMQTLPEKPILDQITRSLFVEKNIQVASFVFTKLQTLANSTNPCEKKMADELKLSLRHSRWLPVSSWITHSQFLRFQVQNHQEKLGYTMDFFNIKSNESVLPNIIGLNLHSNFGSMWNKYLGQVSFTQFGLDHYVRRLLRSQSHNLQSTMSRLFQAQLNQNSEEQQQWQADGADEENGQERVNPRFNYRQELRTLFNSLSVAERNLYDGEPFGLLNIKFKDQEYAFLPLIKELIPEEYLQMFTQQDMSLSTLFNKVKRYLMDDIAIPIELTAASFVHEQSRKIPTTFGIPIQMGFKIPTVFQTTGMIKLELDKTDYLRKVKLVFSHVRPSMVSTFVTKVESWSPIVNTGLKVIAQAKLFVPMDGSIVVDTKKSPMEVKFVWEPVKSLRNAAPVEFITVQSRPITTTLVWPRTLTQWKEPEERTIHEVEYNRVKEHNVIFGEQILGLKIHSRGQWHSKPNQQCNCVGPVCICDKILPLAGPNKWTVTLQPGYDMPKEYVLTISGKLFEAIEKIKMRPQFDNFFTQDNEEFLEKSEFADDYKKYESYGSNKHMINVVLEGKGSNARRHLQTATDCYCSDDMRSCKCKLTLERSAFPMESEPWKFTSEVEALFPQTAYLVSELTSEKKLMSRVKIAWGPVSNMDKYIDIKIVGDRSDAMKQLLQQSIYKRVYDIEEQRNQYKSQFSPVAQFAKVIQYGKLNEYKIDIDYKVNPIVKNITSKMFRVFKAINYWKADINDIQPAFDQQYVPVEVRMTPENKLRAKIIIDPLNLRFVNLSVNTPHEVAIINDIPLWTEFELLNLRRQSTPTFYQKARNTVYNMFTKLFSSEVTRPTCQVRSDSIVTFDQVQMTLPMTNCFTVLAQDCEYADKPKFAILIKKENENEEWKTLKIVTKSHKLVLKGKQTQDSQVPVEIWLDGELKQIEDVEEVMAHGHTVLRCSKSGPYIKCELPDVHVNVFFDGYAANVKVSSIYRNAVCGLCGDNDVEQDDEMNVPENVPFSSVLESHRKYMVRDNECSFDENLINQPNKYQNQQYAWEQDDDQDVYDRFTQARYNQYKQLPKDQQLKANSGEFNNDNDDSSEESTEYNSRKQQQGELWETSPIKVTKMIEQNHQVCFSKIPIPKCPRGTIVKQYKQQPVKTPYVCLPRSDLQTETYIRLAVREQQPIQALDQLTATFTEMEIVPRSCQSNN